MFRQTGVAMLIVIAFMLDSFPVRGQAGGPAAQWNASINFNANAPIHEDAWAFDGVQVPDGRYVIGGYVEMNPFIPASTKKDKFGPDNFGPDRRPGYTILDANGNVLSTKIFGDKTTGIDRDALELRGGRLAQVKWLDCPTDPERNGAILVGNQSLKDNEGKNEVFVIRLDKDLHETWTTYFHPDPLHETGDLSTGYGLDALWNSTSNDFDVTISGDVQLKSDGSRFSYVGTYNFGSNGTPQLVSGTFAKGPRGRINDCQSTTDGAYFIGREYLKTEDVDPGTLTNSDTHPVDEMQGFNDYGIMIGLKANNGTTILSYQEQDIAPSGPGCGSVAGPCTPGKSFSTWNNCSSGSEAADLLLTKGLTDQGETILRVGNDVFALVYIRQLDLTANFFPTWQYDGGGVKIKATCFGEELVYGDYKDAYAYLLKFNTALTNLPDILYLGHFSGGDFHGALIEDKTDGKLVIGGTTADRDICSNGNGGALPDVDLAGGVAEANYLIKVDPSTMTVEWQQHFAGQGKGNCTFGLIQTNDGGYMLIGNNDLDDGTTDIGETFNLIKYAPDNCPTPGGILQDLNVTGNKTWNQVAGTANPTFVNGKVTVHDGATLTIENETIEFGLGKWKLTTKSPDGISGIVVEPGGKLIVKSSTLEGMCDRMWDGISVQANGVKHGSVSISNSSTIKDAVRGIVAGNLSYSIQETPTTLANGSIGIMASPLLSDGGIGGASIVCNNVTFTNCGKAIVWNKRINAVKSAISNTTFECTGPLADPYYVNTFGIGEPMGTEVFCEARGQNNIPFAECVFRNTASFGHQLHNGVGIFGFDSKFWVTGTGTATNFQNLYIGLEASGGPSGIKNHVTAKKLKFDACYSHRKVVLNTVH